jgi:uncharacterized membrane protein (Fun14 family)
MEQQAGETPQQFESLMWLLEHVGLPAAIGLLVGVLVRSVIKSIFILGLLFAAALVVMAKMGVGLGSESAEQASSLLPGLKEMGAALWRTLRSSPAAVIGLALGVVSRERWRHKKGS